VKGTTSGYYQGSCQSFNDTCVWELGKLYLQEYFISDRRINSELYDCSQRTDGSIRCIDGRCGCMYDSDCPPGGPNNLVKGKCDTSTHTCYWPPCKYNSDCVDNYCCDKDPAIPTADQGSGTCNWGPSSSSRIYKNKYLCDPPEWSSYVETTSNKSVLDLIFIFFSHFFQR
jgi:hypothetical protein